ncbi:hypothetical protein PR202_ga00733 [Eleusine coracana subsp. coracana]|uniref:MADS-box domain-containing protein n=1 Tax=Eleusine coracana subsp. coracana TaxID=191504 RepID=A0AAV5BES3_ELECO|nr:hypothetical protein QOZ80_2AG0130750 [Eleusine coracana subsp. coracana]GJM85006.1 hypothetical protein PR202_ga00733 [Eleusine coracana subsp. coracana]
MARKKVNLQYITDDAARRATLRKRRPGLMKKASELATLCDVEVCVVVYAEGEPEPQVWPPSAADATRILGRFNDVPEMEQYKKMMDMEGFLTQRVAKLREQLEKTRRENHAQETVLLLHDVIVGRRPGGLAGLSAEELASLGAMVNSRIQEVTERIERLNKEQGLDDPITTLQLSLPSPASNTAGASDMVSAGPDPQGWLLSVAKDGGFGGESGSCFGGGDAGASISGGLGDLRQLGN